jgi:hypothetical protein
VRGEGRKATKDFIDRAGHDENGGYANGSLGITKRIEQDKGGRRGEFGRKNDWRFPTWEGYYQRVQRTVMARTGGGNRVWSKGRRVQRRGGKDLWEQREGGVEGSPFIAPGTSAQAPNERNDPAMSEAREIDGGTHGQGVRDQDETVRNLRGRRRTKVLDERGPLRSSDHDKSEPVDRDIATTQNREC